jgi:predicted Zn-dependent peptidase
MFKEEPYRLFAYGDAEQLEQISPESLYTYYQKSLTSHPVDVFVVGDVPEQKIEDIMAKYLSWPRQANNEPSPTSLGRAVTEIRQVIEKTKISQGKLHIGCRTQTIYADDDYVPLLVFNGLFGGFSHSKLFRNVRERESLAYYISSSIESHKGFMMIMSGIDFKHFNKTVTIIQDQLDQVKKGQITDEELNQTKAMLINQIKESNDQPFQLMERMYHGIVGGKMRSGNQLMDQINKVRKEDVVKVADKIQIDTIYFLTSNEVGEGDGLFETRV